ncbi:hypothetical protein HRE53_03200 [Acaryochloris sp. 'Moss Beach']|uniref:hypothetical protein n=1 Tax=Acaryochloris TaxID=155977 RepID=UPI001BAE9226|nr:MULTISPECIES: hypothetical protein [Acaryochloris]QUY40997.1 hypothetical protein I1H34_17015 [Acaryochloris marina S15]UJB70166.1 hypothetical protein HRE53_03200 [Acaryochloris sp. 'Moss Beach']
MKNLLTGAGISLLATTIASFGSVNVSLAQETSIDPQSLPGNYGLVRSYDGQNLEVRLLDGTQKTYSVPEGSSESLSQGDLIGFDVDDEGMVSKVQPPAVDEVIRGTVTDVDLESETVTLLPEGADAPVDTRVSQSTIARLGLEPGKEMMVTRFENTWATKVCLPRAAAPVVAPPVQEPIVPYGGAEPDPIPSEPIPALW